MIILDTDLLTLVQREDSPEGLRVRARLAEAIPFEMPVTTIISYEEQMRGWMGAIASARNLEHQLRVYDRLLRHVENYKKINVLPFDAAAAQHYKLCGPQN